MAFRNMSIIPERNGNYIQEPQDNSYCINENTMAQRITTIIDCGQY
jgi:hypothetical protein